MIKSKNVVNGKKITSFSKITISIILSLLLALSLCIYFPTKHEKAFGAPEMSEEEAQAELEKLQPELNNLSNNVVEAENEYFEAVEQSENAQKDIDHYTDKIDESVKSLNAVAINSYKSGGALAEFTSIFCSNDLHSFLYNFQTFDKINQETAKLINEFTYNKQKLEESKIALDENVRLAAEKKDDAEIARSTMDARIDSLQDVIAAAQASRAAAAEAAAAAQRAAQQNRYNPGGGYVPQPSNVPAAPYCGDPVSTAQAIAAAGVYLYSWGAAGPYTFDCSGLVSWCYGKGGAHSWTTNTFVGCSCGFHRISASEAVAGDVVSSSSHCGVYMGGGQMIHAPTFGQVVQWGPVQGDMGYYRLG